MDQNLDWDSYVALRPEFVLKVDGDRPLLYLVDNDDTALNFLPPHVGLGLALLNGQRTLGSAQEIFERIFPEVKSGAGDSDLRQILLSTDRTVRRTTSRRSALGQGHLYFSSQEPLRDAFQVDPRDFVISSRRFADRMRDPRTRYRLASPINMIVAPTHRCLTNCVYCYAERPTAKEMPLGRWAELMDEMSEMGIHVVSPDNGDVLARQDGLEFLGLLIDHRFDFLLSTKAPMKLEQVRALVDRGFAEPVRGRAHRDVQLSVDAADPEVLRRMQRTSSGRAAALAETFTYFVRCSLVPRVKAVITSWNADQVLPLVNAYYPLGARRFTFTRYTRSFFRHQDELFVTTEDERRIAEQLTEASSRYPDAELQGDFLSVGAPPAPEPPTAQEVWDSRSGCGGGWSCLGIAAGGEAFLCEQMVLLPQFVVGNARTQSIQEIWDGEPMLRFIYPQRAEFTGTICADCPEFEECMWAQGRCYRDAWFAFESIYQPPPACPRNDRPGLRIA
ncbi:MAG: hypothetical protein QG597_145 [Actinomycetota bacterium]|nr:hypothetical protein [Actinomycetota bacterium]